VRELLIIVFCLVAVAALEGMRQLIRWTRDRRRGELQRRLQAAVQHSTTTGATLLRKGRLASSPVLNALLETFPPALRAERLLDQADSRLTVAQLFGWTVFAACAGMALAAVVGLGLLVALVLAMVGASVPYLSLVLAASRRSQKLSEQLPEALDMMSRSLRAGHALTSAFEVVATEMPEPVSVEFARAFESQRLGLAVEQAIVQMTHRAPGNRDLKIFAVSALIQRETGGNLAEILGNIGETIRARYRFYGKLRALTAEGRASGVILGALPFVTLLALSVLNPKYLDVLQEPSGRIIMVVAFLLWLVGVIWLVNLMKVDI
jgi:tight adherence protein B